MADEEKNETTEEQPKDDAPEAEQPEAETPEADQPEADQPEADQPEAETPKEDEPPAGGGDDADSSDEGDAAEDGSPDGEADDAPAEEAPEAEAADAAPADDDDLDWKAKARLERSRQSGEAGPQRTPEERAGERAEKRAAAIKTRSSYRRKSREGKEAGEGTPVPEREAVSQKVRQGRVVSDKADKTITVRIDTARRHPAYEKIVRNTSKIHVHDESNEANEGDLVQVVETRPLSRLKRWRLVEVLEKAK